MAEVKDFSKLKSKITLMPDIINQIDLECRLYVKLEVFLSSQKNRDEASTILANYDVALLCLFEMAIVLGEANNVEATVWASLHRKYINHMKITGGPGASESWTKVGGRLAAQ